MEIRADSLIKRYKGRTVVDGVSITLFPGEVVGLLGPNGAGKTTTFYMISGMVRPDGGRVLLNDVEVTTWPVYRRARIGLGYLPQESSIFRGMLNLMTVFGCLMTSRISAGTSVSLAALSKKSCTCSRNLGSSCSSRPGP